MPPLACSTKRRAGAAGRENRNACLLLAVWELHQAASVAAIANIDPVLVKQQEDGEFLKIMKGRVYSEHSDNYNLLYNK